MGIGLLRRHYVKNEPVKEVEKKPQKPVKAKSSTKKTVKSNDK